MLILAEPTVTFAFVIEKQTLLNPTPFLEDDPYNLLKSGKFNAVPWICGTTENEGLAKTAYILRNDSYKTTFLKNLDVNLPIFLALGITVSSDDMPAVYQKIIDFYLQGDTQLSNSKSLKGFVDIIGDRFFSYGTYQSALFQATKTKVPVWVYRYNYISELTSTDYFSFNESPVNGTTGVCHTDDLIPLLYSPAIFHRPLTSFSDIMMSYNMVQMWTSFATFGNPSPNNKFVKYDWKPLVGLYGKTRVNSSDLQFLYMEGPNANSQNLLKFEMRNDFFVKRMKFWDNLRIVEYPVEKNNAINSIALETELPIAMKLLQHFVIILVALINQNESIVITIKDGKIRGIVSQTRNYRNYYSFRGIPFAKPPIGNLRFKDPESPIPWGDNILDATKDAPKCIQKNFFTSLDPKIEGKEDCLYLNVYTPKLSKKCNKKLPVMVYIFFGGFFAGSGRSDYAGPEYLLDEDVVLVSINYRLGVLGFLSLGNDDAAGNWGMKDQVFALKWIQENIAAFGGDKNRVTLFGSSAGGASSHLHMFSRFSKGLFHRAISQSGTALLFWTRPLNNAQVRNAKMQASFVGCNPNATSKDIVECLRSIPVDVLVESSKKFKLILAEPTITFALVIEKQTLLNPTPFLEDDPYNLLESGKLNAVPWICGVTENEGLAKTGYILRNDSYKTTFLKNLDVNLAIMLALGITVSSGDMPAVYQKIIDFYLQGDTQLSNTNSVRGFVDIIGDRIVSYGIYQSALFQATKTKVPVWVYRYNYLSELTTTDYFSFNENPVNGTIGVCHTDDLIPLLYSPAIFHRPLTSFFDMIMSFNMVQMWTSFATFGNPSLNNRFIKYDWKPLVGLYGKTRVNSSDLQYLYMQGPNANSQNPLKFEMRNDFFVNRMKFWDNLRIVEYPVEVV
ncbi:hypothetical protein RN001_008448 [Aquatica leii]|uniref:Carboxylesterase type B domain-containing protein n=1 Tax=Aquatica leii TaxID=1421715 RepID=A0AAN7P9N1_9COLE|nr:hypothetical protein RN001_008448 [Aquatica leii]